MTWWKFMFDMQTSTWQAYGRAVFVEAETKAEALVLARAAAERDYPGAEIRDVAIGRSTATAAATFAEKKRRLAEWQANAAAGRPNTRESLEVRAGDVVASVPVSRLHELLDQTRDSELWQLREALYALIATSVVR